MAPYDKYANDLPLVIMDDALGVHSVRQEGDDTFEVSLLALRHNIPAEAKSEKNRSFKDRKKSKKQKKAKTVSFDENVHITRIPSKSEITPEQKGEMWVSCFDWQAIQREKQSIARDVLIGVISIEDPKHRSTLRGLETLVTGIAFRRRENIHVARSFVLREQMQARLEEVSLDADRLAWCYGSLVQESRIAAHKQGLEDFCSLVGDEKIISSESFHLSAIV